LALFYEVEMRDEQPRRAAMLGGQGRALIGLDDPGPPTAHIRDGQVGRVAAAEKAIT
jgi:hypothetical protein